MKRYVLDNARMILRAAELESDELAIALNRVYRHYSGDDIFAIAGIKYEDHYVMRPQRQPLESKEAEIKQLSFNDAGVEVGECQDRNGNTKGRWE
ncbi:MAG: hypothetical protein IJ520_02475 [Synergistaceae bacterium]|nr:hypothetical protein [Synergistaceae bacterium]